MSPNAAGLVGALEVACLGGLLCLDDMACLQIMISQPLPSCFLIGWAFHQPLAGAGMGIAFQLLFASDLPVGSHLSKDASLMSISALGAFLACNRQAPIDRGELALAAILALAAEPLFNWSSSLVRRANARLIPWVNTLLLKQRHLPALLAAQGGLVLFFLRGFLTVLAFSLIGGRLVSLGMSRLPGEAVSAIRWTFTAFPLIGAAHFFVTLKSGRLQRFNPATLISLSRRKP